MESVAFIQSYAEALIACAGVVALVLLVGILFSFLGMLAHWLGQASNYPAASLSSRSKRVALVSLTAVPLFIVAAGLVDHHYAEVRKQRAAEQRAKQANQRKARAQDQLNKQSKILVGRLNNVLPKPEARVVNLLQTLSTDLRPYIYSTERLASVDEPRKDIPIGFHVGRLEIRSMRAL